MPSRRSMVRCSSIRRATVAGSLAVGASLVTAAREAEATPTLTVNVEAAAARSIGPTKSEQFGWGGGGVIAPELVLTRALSIELAAGALGLAAGRGEPPPGVAPTADGVAVFAALGPRLRPFAMFGDEEGVFRASGAWLTAGLGVGVTRDVARPALRVALGYDLATTSVSVGPFAGFFQLVEPDGGSLRPEDARVGLLGLHGTFGRGGARAAAVPPGDAVDRAEPCAPGSSAPGCTPPERDADGDSIPDARDACPNVPEERNGIDDADGCPDALDRDVDGIPDARDACPDVAGPAGSSAGDEGCPPPTDFQVDGEAIVLSEHLRFSSGHVVLDEAGLRVLGSVADFLKRHSEYVRLTVQGHTDDVGPGPFNMMLSRRRAEEVIVQLVARGVERERLRPEGRGENAPLDPSPTQAARRVNRRVQLVIDQKNPLPGDGEAVR